MRAIIGPRFASALRRRRRVANEQPKDAAAAEPAVRASGRALEFGTLPTDGRMAYSVQIKVLKYVSIFRGAGSSSSSSSWPQNQGSSSLISRPSHQRGNPAAREYQSRGEQEKWSNVQRAGRGPSPSPPPPPAPPPLPPITVGALAPAGSGASASCSAANRAHLCRQLWRRRPRRRRQQQYVAEIDALKEQDPALEAELAQQEEDEEFEEDEEEEFSAICPGVEEWWWPVRLRRRGS